MASQSGGKKKTTSGRSTSSSSRSSTAKKGTSTRKSASSGSGTARKSTTSAKSTARKTASSKSASSRSSAAARAAAERRAAEEKRSSSVTRNGGTTLLVIVALLVLLYAVGVGKGAIDTSEDDQAGAFASFLLSGFDGGDGGNTEDEYTPPAAETTTETEKETNTEKETSATEKESTTAKKTTSTTTAKPTTTTAKKTTTTTTAKPTTTTAKKTTTTTTAKPTTTTAKKTTATTTAKTTAATTRKTTTTTQKPTTTTPAVIINTEPTTTTTAVTKPTYANADNVVNPNYESPYYIVVYAGSSQSVAIYAKDNGGKYSVLEKCFTCSTGADSSPTRTGQYKIRAKYRWRWLVGNVYGQYNSSISSDYLFHSVPYKKEKENTLDMTEYDKLGTPASHGCIRLCVRDTKWIYDNCPIGTQVNIVNKSGPAGAGVPSLNYDSAYKGWDPTDPHSDNPYK